MYTQGLDQKGQPADKREALESAADLESFQKRIDAEEKIEAKDWMPEAASSMNSPFPSLWNSASISPEKFPTMRLSRPLPS